QVLVAGVLERNVGVEEGLVGGVGVSRLAGGGAAVTVDVVGVEDVGAGRIAGEVGAVLVQRVGAPGGEGRGRAGRDRGVHVGDELLAVDAIHVRDGGLDGVGRHVQAVEPFALGNAGDVRLVVHLEALRVEVLRGVVGDG